MKWLQFPWRCRERSWTVSGPDLRNACVETEAILRALFSKHKFSNWRKTKWLFICFSFMTNKQIKNSCVDFFNFWNFPVSLPNSVLIMSKSWIRIAREIKLSFQSSAPEVTIEWLALLLRIRSSPRTKSHPWERLSLRFLATSCSPSRQTSIQHSKLGHGCPLASCHSTLHTTSYWQRR